MQKITTFRSRDHAFSDILLRFGRRRSRNFNDSAWQTVHNCQSFILFTANCCHLHIICLENNWTFVCYIDCLAELWRCENWLAISRKVKILTYFFHGQRHSVCQQRGLRVVSVIFKWWGHRPHVIFPLCSRQLLVKFGCATTWPQQSCRK